MNLVKTTAAIAAITVCCIGILPSPGHAYDNEYRRREAWGRALRELADDLKDLGKEEPRYYPRSCRTHVIGTTAYTDCL